VLLHYPLSLSDIEEEEEKKREEEEANTLGRTATWGPTDC